MGTMAKRTMALAMSLCMLLLMLPVSALAYSFSETVGALTVSYESELVVPKGGSVNLSVQASTTDGHAISYKWSKLKATDQVDDSGYTVWQAYKLSGATAATYALSNVTEDMSFLCEVWCDNSSYDAVYEDVYAADVLQLNVPVSCSKTGDQIQEKYYLYTPSESGTYEFTSSGSVEARLYVFNDVNIDSNNLISDYESYSENGKKGGKAVAQLSAGKTYAIQSYLGASATGDFSVSVSQYADTDFTLTSKQTAFNVDNTALSTTMKVTASFSGSAKGTDKITYQWYQYDPVEWDYVPVSGATGSSLTVQNSSVKWNENSFRCDATAEDGSSDSLYFKLYHDSGWYAYGNGYDERVAYNTSATLNVKAGQSHDILNEHGEWIAEEFTEDSSGKTYQWYVLEENSSYYNGDKFVAISGATGAQYTTGTVTGNQRYMCVVTDSQGVCDYRQYYVRPILMNVSVDKTYYAVDSGDSLTLKVSADATESGTRFDYYWYKGTLGTTSGSGSSVDYTAVDKYRGKSSMSLSKVTETQYLKCEVWAYADKSGKSVEDYVEVDFVVNPGTGYFEMYTTSDDKNVKGASNVATSETTKNPDGSTTTVTTTPDGQTSQTTTVENSDGSTTMTTTTVKADGTESKSIVVTAANGSVTSQVITSAKNSEGNTVETTVTTKFNAKGAITSITEESVIAKAASDTSAIVTLSKDSGGNVTDATASVETVTGDSEATITAGLLSQMKEAAGKKVKNIVVTMKVNDKKGKVRYSVKFNSSDITAGEELYLYRYDTKSDSCKAVSDEELTVSKKGSITVSASENDTYLLAADEKDALKLYGQTTISDEETPLASGESSFNYWIILMMVLIIGVFGVAILFVRRNDKK